MEFDLTVRFYYYIPKDHVGVLYDTFSNSYDSRIEGNAKNQIKVCLNVELIAGLFCCSLLFCSVLFCSVAFYDFFDCVLYRMSLLCSNLKTI
jgi:hypothetical protein